MAQLENALIKTIHAIVDPDKIGFLSAPLTSAKLTSAH